MRWHGYGPVVVEEEACRQAVDRGEWCVMMFEKRRHLRALVIHLNDYNAVEHIF